MADDIDALAAAGHAEGQDAIEVAVQRVALMLEVRDQVLESRSENPATFPAFGSAAPKVVGRRILAGLLDAGWSPPSNDAVQKAAERSRAASARYDTWMASLSPEDKARALEHYGTTGEWPPDLRPPRGER